jgi:transcriptional regulator with XRE-family HTH domain
MSFSDRIITLRRERNLTQQAFTDLTTIHVQQIQRYEANTSQEEKFVARTALECPVLKHAVRQGANTSPRTNTVAETVK